MKRVLFAVLMGMSVMTFVSCGTTEINEENIKGNFI